MTKAQLIEALKDFPDETPVIMRESFDSFFRLMYKRVAVVTRLRVKMTGHGVCQFLNLPQRNTDEAILLD